MTVLVVPIAVGVPAVLVFIPPSVVGAPAILASLVQLMARVFRLLAIPAVMLHRFVESVIGLCQAMMALFFICPYVRGACEKQKSRESGASQKYFPERQVSQPMFSLHLWFSCRAWSESS
jgi:hypothetical protein